MKKVLGYLASAAFVLAVLYVATRVTFIKNLIWGAPAA